ncbi:MAG: type I restriction enzyme HsdR N-terminal domain-containing protein [Desulfosalsimonadaceae bacterium]
MNQDVQKSYEMITDFITGRSVANIGAEEHRQAVEKYLYKEKGFGAEYIGVDVPLSLTVRGEPYNTRLDLLVTVGEKPFMVIKCAAGSLESREKEVIAAARVLQPIPAPYAAVSDGKTAFVYDSAKRTKIGEGLSQIPAYKEAERFIASYEPGPVDKKHLEREKIIFKSYDSMNLNVQRRLGQ